MESRNEWKLEDRLRAKGKDFGLNKPLTSGIKFNK